MRYTPRSLPGPNGELQAPHLNVLILMRGLLKQLHTRLYFPGEASNDGDAVLMSVPSARRNTLIASRDEGSPGALRWDIVLASAHETVFFAY